MILTAGGGHGFLTVIKDVRAGQRRSCAIAYQPEGYYYANNNAVVDPGEVSYTSSTEGVGRWTPRLMKAAHNYHMTQKEPGYWSHNTNYTAQLLIDSIEDLGGNVGAFARPVGF